MRRLLAITTASLLVLVACSDSDDGSGDSSGDDGSTEEQVLVFNGQGNHLDVYDAEPPFDTVRLITNAEDDPDAGIDMNGQLCFYEDGDTTYFVAGEDTGQPERPPGWGIFELDGDSLDNLSATQVAKLTPTYAGNEPDGAENFGCAVLADGRIVTSDIGSQELGPGTGQLMIWFPPFEGGLDGEVGAIPYCKLDTGIPTALGLAVDADENIYLASARAADNAPEFGVWRYSGPFPTGPTPEEGCDDTDDTGAGIVSGITKELFIPAGENGLATPSGLAIDTDGTFVVASVFSGVINRYDADGAFLATILEPGEGEAPGADPMPTGTPQGVGIGPDGTIYYADIAIVIRDGIGPASGEGTLRRITFVDGQPQAPEIMGSGLAYPDGIGVWVLGA